MRIGISFERFTAPVLATGLAGLVLSAVAVAQTDPCVRAGAINGQTGATATSPLPVSSVTSNTPQGVSEFFANGPTTAAGRTPPAARGFVRGVIPGRPPHSASRDSRSS